jgi:uncharacterized membrane protein
MIQGNEIIMLLLGIGVLIFILGNRPKLKRLPSSSILIAGFIVLFVGWVMTVLEGFYWKELLNLFEHICYAISSVLIAAWSWKVFERRKGER